MTTQEASDREPYREIARVADHLGVELSGVQIDKLERFSQLLQRWNGVYNLTSREDEGGILRYHLADCLAVVGPLIRQTGLVAAARMLDVGSGGGLPGVVLAVAVPQWEVTCLDAVGKKAAFTTQAAASLDLPNLASFHARVETWRAAPFDVICSRAFASLPVFIDSTRSLLADSGLWMAMKGKRPVNELLSVQGMARLFHVEQLQIPDLGEERCIVWLRKSC